jgi:flagellar biosynthetic protein FliR
LRIALPGITALLVTNIAFGVISRTAPAMNLFAVGLPVTLAVGMAVVLYGLSTLQAGFTDLLRQAMVFMGSLVGG